MTNETIASAVDEDVIPVDETAGQITESEKVQADTPEEEQELFDFTEIGDKFVKLQVDGQEVLVPIKEAFAGYQRQADYTRKTQEVSEQRKRLEYASAIQEALEKDPAHTLQLLQQQFGTNVQSEDEDLWLDPQTKQFKELEQRVARFEQDKAMDELTRTIDSLQSKYGEDFNADEVVAKALATGANDLEAIFKQITFDKVYSSRNESSKKLADEQARLEAKRGAQVVSSASTAKATIVKTAPPKTVFEAFETAKKSLNL
jgi:antitoxin component of MazEF toxin-antitoxin module